jgi:choloylglycine hydrolase
MANDPPYDQQLALLSRYRGFGGELPPPGDILSRDRFVRTSYFLQYLPEPSNYQEAVAGVVSLGRNAAVPAGAPYDDFSVYPTWWISATDVTNRTYYFQPTTSPNLIWLELDSLDLAEGAAVRCIDPYRLDLVGDVTDQLTVAPPIY